MPELPDVEKAAELVRDTAQGHKIERVETVEDLIAFSGISHEEFANEIVGRKVTNVGRYGKVFYIELDGEGRFPVLHFGMTGMLQIKGQSPTIYKEVPRKPSAQWPPRFMKFILHIRNETTNRVTELAFLDARRLGRIRLCADPLKEAPISGLGFDPILCMLPLEEFKKSVLKRSCPIKALLLDQSFSAGVGNWVADEILYHARVHPEERCNALSEEQLVAIHNWTEQVCRIAVEAKADEERFPENWLFKHRWGKGKKQKPSLKLPSGEFATINWITVGGRTSAYVAELQHLNSLQPLDRKHSSDHNQSPQEVSPEEGSTTSPTEKAVGIVTRGRKRKVTDKVEPSSPRRTKSKRS
ncbi:hypothetical protein JAAARDRAFT_196275 [Jaapia argillacea MUCL 33604]|uniref:Formamidopyrimidine-DNA glycosylase catalytic domain-containing protein n=1 Tax=Jaapia argillacea MUCL 33604 TaxID=933084 RepID=A0A067PUC2_9AGAM|nr:hypothetical protein JAAARDRAFT_196275 [Jaapia argillacea MUCL 33604]